MSRLQICDVGKRYGDLWALRQVSLELDRGVVGLLGPNGAGKSTLMRILATLSAPTEGAVFWKGMPLPEAGSEVRRVLGYLPQDFGVYPKLTAAEFLRYLAAAKGMAADQRVDDLLGLVNLHGARDRRLETFSGGMQRRVGIAQALLNDPELLIVDEPTVGLDPEERARFRELLSELGSERIVLLSTHIVSDVEAAAESIAVLDGGRLATVGTPGDLLGLVENKVWRLNVDPDRVPELRRTHAVVSAAHRGEDVRVRLVADAPPIPDAEPASPALEDAYLWLMRGDDAGGTDLERDLAAPVAGCRSTS